jgi:cation transport regulator ChaC
MGPTMEASVGILAFGSLIDNPGAEIEAALVGRKLKIRTPFCVEFARSSTKRGGAPTLVPIQQGGAPVLGQILMVNVSEQEAKNRLWRREIDKVGQGGHYIRQANPGLKTLTIDRYENFEGVAVVLAARFAATIEPLTAARLAELAIESVRQEQTGRDGITYLIDAKRNGITTPLSAAYEQEILRRVQALDLNDALRKIRGKAGYGTPPS